MADLSSFPVAKRWPAEHPDRLQLYSAQTPNGVKISIMLEEIGLPYEAHYVDIAQNESWTPEFLALNPNGKIPARKACPTVCADRYSGLPPPALQPIMQ